jgi:enoyl-CoA hydratase/carnithine racemase
MALYCDVRFCADDAKLTTAYTRRGLIAESGSAWLLRHLVGPGRALDLLLSARVVLGAEAAQIGLVEFALPADRVLTEAIAYADELATRCAPRSMAVVKAQVAGAAGQDLDAALRESNELATRSFKSPDVREGGLAFQERRSPRFLPLERSSERPPEQRPYAPRNRGEA